MTKKAKISPKSRAMLDQFKSEARQRVLKREFVQFRADKQMMDLLLKVADYRGQPYGVMVREWVEQRLSEEAQHLPLSAVELPSGETLTESSPRSAIERAIFDHQHGVIKLTDKQYKILMDWLLDRHLAEKYRKRA
jgi:hypothetical protein